MADTGQFDVDAARKAGYSDDEILQHLTASRGFDVQGALTGGYTKQEIINHLSSSPAMPAPNKGLTGPSAPQTPLALQQNPTANAIANAVPSERADMFNANAAPIAAAAQAAVPAQAGAELGQAAGRFLGKYAPSAVEAQRLGAGQALNDVTQAIGNAPVNTTEALGVAQKAKELAAGGTTLPQVLSKFLDRMGLSEAVPTAGGAPNPVQPLTFGEGRAFAKNAGRLSVDESLKATGEMKGYIKQFAGQIGDALKQTAEEHGFQPQYSDALKEYSNAKTVQEMTQVIKKWGIGTILAAVGASGAGFLANKGYQLSQQVGK